MSTAGEPAPTAIEPRTPTPYLTIGAVALSGAAICIITLAVLIGATPHTPVTPLILALALGVDVGAQFGLWGLREHRLDQREDATRLADETRYTTWLAAETDRKAAYEALSLRVDQLSSRVGWQIQQLAERRGDGRPAPNQRQRSRPPRKRKSPSSLPQDERHPGPDPKWMDDVAEAFRLGKQTAKEPPLTETP